MALNPEQFSPAFGKFEERSDVVNEVVVCFGPPFASDDVDSPLAI